MDSKQEAAAMEEGRAGLELGEKELAPIDPSFTSSPTKSSIKLSHKSSTEKCHSWPNASWDSVARLIGRQTLPQTERNAPVSYKRGDREPIVTGLEQRATGYPRLAALLDSDDNFMIYRRFGFLSTRLLLEQQDQLRLLEEELEGLDQDFAENFPRRNLTRDLPEEDSAERMELLERIQNAYCKYAKILCAAREVMSFNKPASDEWQSVENYIWNQKQVEEKETNFIYHRDDLVTLRPGREHAWLDASVEKLLKLCNCRLVEWFFCSKESKQKSRGIEVYYARHRIERFVVTIITFMILSLLIIPVYLLYHVTSNRTGTGTENAVCMGILLVSTLLFSAVISLFTRARRHEIFAASAAYCAVLVVFIGNIGSRGSGQSILS